MWNSVSKELSVVVLVLAAVLEVAGDAIVRAGLRGRGIAVVAAGFVVLGSYGVVVNLLQVDFSKLLGVYIGVFALVSILTGRIVFHEQVSLSTWLGLSVIVAGSLIIHLGRV